MSVAWQADPANVIQGLMTGSSGGAGAQGTNISFGGNGGDGGNAGSIYIDAAAQVTFGSIQPGSSASLHFCANTPPGTNQVLFGHDRGIPFLIDPFPDRGQKSDSVEKLGERVGLCADFGSGTTKQEVRLLSLIMSYQPGDSSKPAQPVPVLNCPGSGMCPLPGSGGLAGGSVYNSNGIKEQARFTDSGTAGSYGMMPTPRAETAFPEAILQLIRSSRLP
jgi:hypothetical protein